MLNKLLGVELLLGADAVLKWFSIQYRNHENIHHLFKSSFKTDANTFLAYPFIGHYVLARHALPIGYAKLGCGHGRFWHTPSRIIWPLLLALGSI